MFDDRRVWLVVRPARSGLGGTANAPCGAAAALLCTASRIAGLTCVGPCEGLPSVGGVACASLALFAVWAASCWGLMLAKAENSCVQKAVKRHADLGKAHSSTGLINGKDPQEIGHLVAHMLGLCLFISRDFLFMGTLATHCHGDLC